MTDFDLLFLVVEWFKQQNNMSLFTVLWHCSSGLCQTSLESKSTAGITPSSSAAYQDITFRSSLAVSQTDPNVSWRFVKQLMTTQYLLESPNLLVTFLEDNHNYLFWLVLVSCHNCRKLEKLYELFFNIYWGEMRILIFVLCNIRDTYKVISSDCLVTLM